jgi:hypothetical protein
VRQDGVGRECFAAEICQDGPSQRVKVEKPHGVCSFSLAEERQRANDFDGVESRKAKSRQSKAGRGSLRSAAVKAAYRGSACNQAERMLGTSSILRRAVSQLALDY